jgi:hypothetical protein
MHEFGEGFQGEKGATSPEWVKGLAIAGTCLAHLVVYALSSVFFVLVGFNIIADSTPPPEPLTDSMGPGLLMFFKSLCLSVFVFGPLTTFLFSLGFRIALSRYKEKSKRKNDL